MTMAEQPILLKATGLTKRFGPVVANDGVSFDVSKGELHCLFGENGAGKSTLSGMLHGELRPDEGQIQIDGKDVHFRSPSDAISLGIGMVHQHFVLAEAMTVLENVAIAARQTGLWLDTESVTSRLATLCEQLGISIDPDRPLWQLSVGEKQWVEIVKALFLDARLLILDEPTAVLTPQESDNLFEMVERLCANGMAVIIVTHKLREIMKADKITVLRRGRSVGTVRSYDTSPEALTEMMVGASVEKPTREEKRTPGRVVVQTGHLTAVGDWGETVVDNVSLMIRSGEILGIAGVAGNGQKTLLDLLSGIRKPASGSILIGDRQLEGQGPKAFMNAGVGLIPEDRFKEGLIGTFSIAENLILGQQRDPSVRKGTWISRDRMTERAAEAIERYAIVAPGPETPVKRLSGGNAQKVILARELKQASVLLLANQPTRGLDVGVIATVCEELRRKRDAGVAVILVSEELEDLFALSDRLCVMFEGRIVGYVDPATGTRDVVGAMMAGHTVDGQPA